MDADWATVRSRTNALPEAPIRKSDVSSAAYARLPLNALRVFEAVASRLSFADAAEALHVTPAAVSQQIKSLEEYLQVQLFKRAGVSSSPPKASSSCPVYAAVSMSWRLRCST